MKFYYAILCLVALSSFAVSAQPCTNSDATGSASNAFSSALNNARPLAVDNALNTLVFIHRNNAGIFGGHSGNLRYDISTNNGASWQNNLGPLNPLSVNGTNGARYPSAAIYNPSGNTDPNNAYIAYYAPTVGATWGDHVSGVRKLNGTGNTESYNQVGTSQNQISRGMCKGANGSMWAIDAINNGTQVTGYRVLKGTWNGVNDYTWAVNTTLSPAFNTAYNGVSNTADFSMAFDPSGQIGWVVLLTDITVGTSDYSFNPVFYHTEDGGLTWSGPEQIKLGNFSCISSFISPGNVPTAAFEVALTVDVYGHPHALMCVGSNPNSYSIFFTQTHRMIDLTREYGVWNAMDLGLVTSGRSTFGTSPNQLNMDMNPQASRTDDGTHVFFAWAGSDPAPTTNAPNLYGSGYDVVNKVWTSMKDFTTCNLAISGDILFPKAAENMLEVSGGWELPVVYFTPSNINDLLQATTYNYLDSLLFIPADFTLPQCETAVTFANPDSVLLCEGVPGTLDITSSHNVILWDNLATTATIPISGSGWHYVTVRTDCCLGRDSIYVWIDSLATSAFTATDNNLDVSFTDASTGDPMTWLWEFGDGNVSNLQNPNYTYALPGVYTVCLTVTDACGIDSSCQTLTITCPVATPAFSSSIGNGGTVSFTNMTTPAATSYSWDFGDGNTSALENPSNVYAASGTYTVCLTVTDDCGSDTYCETLTVDATLGIQSMESGAIRIFPNPVESFLYVKGTDLEANSWTLRLVNALGENYWNSTTAGNSVDEVVSVQDLAPGVYFLEISSETATMRYKFVRK